MIDTVKMSILTDFDVIENHKWFIVPQHKSLIDRDVQDSELVGVVKDETSFGGFIEGNDYSVRGSRMYLNDTEQKIYLSVQEVVQRKETFEKATRSKILTVQFSAPKFLGLEHGSTVPFADLPDVCEAVSMAVSEYARFESTDWLISRIDIAPTMKNLRFESDAILKALSFSADSSKHFKRQFDNTVVIARKSWQVCNYNKRKEIKFSEKIDVGYEMLRSEMRLLRGQVVGQFFGENRKSINYKNLDIKKGRRKVSEKFHEIYPELDAICDDKFINLESLKDAVESHFSGGGKMPEFLYSLAFQQLAELTDVRSFFDIAQDAGVRRSSAYRYYKKARVSKNNFLIKKNDLKDIYNYYKEVLNNELQKN